MRIIIKTKNLELTQALESYITEKIESVKKFVNILKEDLPERGKTLAEVFVEVEKETKHHLHGDVFSAEALVRLPGKKFIARAKSDDLYKAIVAVKEELKSEVEKYKFKKIDRTRREQKKIRNKV